METERQKLYANLVRWLKINFGEVFSASIHIKALRVFVESVLRYEHFSSDRRSNVLLLLTRFGLPVNFVAIVIHPTRKSTKRLRDVLDQLFGYLDQSKNSRHEEVNSSLILSTFFIFYSSKLTFLVYFLHHKNIIHMFTSNWILIISIWIRNKWGFPFFFRAIFLSVYVIVIFPSILFRYIKKQFFYLPNILIFDF